MSKWDVFAACMCCVLIGFLLACVLNVTGFSVTIRIGTPAPASQKDDVCRPKPGEACA